MAALNYYSYDAATGASTQQTQAQFHLALTRDVERALDAFLIEPAKPKSLREIQAEEIAAAAKAVVDKKAAEIAAAAKAVVDKKAADEAEAAAKAELQRHRALGHEACWLCERDKGIEVYHQCKENICPTATTGYTRFDRWGNPDTAYPAHPLRESFSMNPRSYSNNHYKRAMREYDIQMARENALKKAREAVKLKKAEEATGLTGEEALAEYKRLRHAPATGLAAFLDVSGGLVEPALPAKKKGQKKPTVEKFSLDEI